MERVAAVGRRNYRSARAAGHGIDVRRELAAQGGEGRLDMPEIQTVLMPHTLLGEAQACEIKDADLAAGYMDPPTYGLRSSSVRPHALGMTSTMNSSATRMTPGSSS